MGKAYEMPEKYRKLSGDGLKWIAVATMLIDHIAYGIVLPVFLIPLAPVAKGTDAYHLYQFYRLMRGIGRIAFPIYCFLLVEGFRHTKSRAAYAMRLFLFALLSEIPFDLAFSRTFWHPEYQNVFFTLLLGLLAIWAMECFREREFPGFLCAVAAGIAAEWLNTDYGWQGVLLIVLFYLLQNWRVPQVLFGSLALYNEFPFVLAGYALLLLYNGKRKTKGILKYFFYVFYPAHLFLIHLCAVMLNDRL